MGGLGNAHRCPVANEGRNVCKEAAHLMHEICVVQVEEQGVRHGGTDLLRADWSVLIVID